MKYIPRDSTTEILNTKDFDKRHFDIDSNDPCGYKPRIYIKNVENNNNIFMGSILNNQDVVIVVVLMLILRYILKFKELMLFLDILLLLKDVNVLIVVVKIVLAKRQELIFRYLTL